MLHICMLHIVTIIHRDIKPENVLVSHDFKVVRLADLGLSKLKTMNKIVSTWAYFCLLQPGTPSYYSRNSAQRNRQICGA